MDNSNNSVLALSRCWHIVGAEHVALTIVTTDDGTIETTLEVLE